METWIFYALILAFIYTISTLLQEYIIIKHDDCHCINYKIYISAGIFALIYLLYHVNSDECKHSTNLKENILNTDNKVWLIIFIIGILFIIATKCWTLSITNNGNSGYISAISNLSIIFITIYSSYMYADMNHFNIQKFAGILVIVFGVGLITV